MTVEKEVADMLRASKIYRQIQEKLGHVYADWHIHSAVAVVLAKFGDQNTQLQEQRVLREYAERTLKVAEEQVAALVAERNTLREEFRALTNEAIKLRSRVEDFERAERILLMGDGESQ